MSSSSNAFTFPFAIHTILSVHPSNVSHCATTQSNSRAANFLWAVFQYRHLAIVIGTKSVFVRVCFFWLSEPACDQYCLQHCPLMATLSGPSISKDLCGDIAPQRGERELLRYLLTVIHWQSAPFNTWCVSVSYSLILLIFFLWPSYRLLSIDSFLKLVNCCWWEGWRYCRSRRAA